MNKLFSFCNECYWFTGSMHTPSQCQACSQMYATRHRTLFKPISEEKQTKYKCHYSECVSYNETYSGNCTYRSGDEIPTCKYYKQYKEQKMSFKPTSKCTLKNIATKINKTGCSEAKAEFFDVLLEFTKGGLNNEIDSNVVSHPGYIIILTKTEKRRNWLSEHGFIEEDIMLKECPFCKTDKDVIFRHLTQNRGHVKCANCNITQEATRSKQEAIKAWNKRS